MSINRKPVLIKRKDDILIDLNVKKLNSYQWDLGSLNKGESIKFKNNGWSKQNITCPSPEHIDNHPSAGYNSKSETIHCLVCRKKWNAKQWDDLYPKKIKKKFGLKKNKEKILTNSEVNRLKEKRLSSESNFPLLPPYDFPGVHSIFIKNHNIVAAYPYTDEDGLTQYYKFRKHPKGFMLGQIERWVMGDDCDLELCLNLKGINKWYPYNLPKVLKAENIIIAEGEKDCDNLQRWLDENGFDNWATTTFIVANKERINQCCQYLKNKMIYLCADIDGPEKNFKGEKYMYQTIGAIVAEVGQATKVLVLPLESGKDVSDLIESNPNKLLTAIKENNSLPDWTINYFIDESEVPKEVLKINKNYAVVRAAPKTLILYDNQPGNTDDRPFILYDINGTRQFFRNQKIPNPQAEIDGRFKAFINPFEYWLDWPGRRTFTKIVFEPSGKVKPSEYNTWQGFIPSEGAQNCDLILKHIFEIAVNGIKDHFDWLMDWFADIIQNPSAEPRGTAIVLKGGRGSGKSIIGEYVGKIFGPHYQLIDTPDHIFGKFNYHLTQKLFVQVEEAVWGGDKTREGKLKSLITSKVMPVEIKFGDIFSTKNYLRLMITSNENWVVPAGPDERRFFVLKTSDKYQKRNDEKYKSHNEKCRKYFDALVTEMQNGGVEALYLYLKGRKIKCDLRYAPHTEGLAEQKMLGMDIVYRWLYARIAEDRTLIDRSKKWRDGRDEFKSELKSATRYIINKLQNKWVTDWVPYEVIYHDFSNFEKKAGKGRYGTSKKTFSQTLKEILGIDSAKQITLRLNDPDSDSPDKRRIMCIKFPTHKECKRIFFEKTGIKAEL
jgi:hypothetical protein